MLTIKKSTALFLVLAVICITSFFVVSCHNGIGKGLAGSVVIPVPVDSSPLAKIHHFIPLDSINLLRRAFDVEQKRMNTTDLFVTESEGFNKPAVLEILKNPDCVGIRIYYGIVNDPANNGRKSLKMIIVGTDTHGKDLFIPQGSLLAARLTGGDGGLEYGQCCQGQPAR